MTKTCNLCKIEKEKSCFYIVKKRTKPTFYHICKDCSAVVQKKFKSYYRDWELQKKYGITLDEYKHQCSVRQNVCDICEHPTPTLHVDHSHVTGKVRGYLCGHCNRGLGQFKDKSHILDRASLYLKGHDE